MKTPTNNLVTILIAVGAIILLILIALLIVLDKDPTAYVGSITAIIASLTAAGVLGQKLNTIGKNVNGKMTALLDENAKLRAHAAQFDKADFLRSDPAPELMSEDTIDGIVRDVNRLPSPTGNNYVPQHARDENFG